MNFYFDLSNVLLFIVYSQGGMMQMVKMIQKTWVKDEAGLL